MIQLFFHEVLGQSTGWIVQLSWLSTSKQNYLPTEYLWNNDSLPGKYNLLLGRQWKICMRIKNLYHGWNDKMTIFFPKIPKNHIFMLDPKPTYTFSQKFFTNLVSFTYAWFSGIDLKGLEPFICQNGPKNHENSVKKGIMLVQGPGGPRSAHFLLFLTSKSCSTVKKTLK